MILEERVVAVAQEVKGQDLRVEYPHSELEYDYSIYAPPVQLL
jgi:hypothetical protein